MEDSAANSFAAGSSETRSIVLGFVWVDGESGRATGFRRTAGA